MGTVPVCVVVVLDWAVVGVVLVVAMRVEAVGRWVGGSVVDSLLRGQSLFVLWLFWIVGLPGLYWL